jgi:hypothetical protein
MPDYYVRQLGTQSASQNSWIRQNQHDQQASASTTDTKAQIDSIEVFTEFLQKRTPLPVVFQYR